MARHDSESRLAIAGNGHGDVGAREAEDLVDAFQTRPVRRDLLSMANSDPVLETLRDAVRRMKRLPQDDRRNWERLARIHRRFCVHDNWFFLPWHRAYLYFFEQICRRLTGVDDFALPYWNWARQARIPRWFWSTPLVHSRAATPGSQRMRSMAGGRVLDRLLNEPNFKNFAGYDIHAGDDPHTTHVRTGFLEGTPHNHIHNFVGRDMAGRARSPRDPVFWVHHAMIDACWFEWNFRRSHGNPDDDDWNSREMRGFVDGDGNPATMTVADSLLLPVTSYQYDDLQLGVALLGSREPLPTDAVEAKKIAQEGTDVELEVMAQFIEPVNAQARVGEPVRASMDIRGAPLGGLFGDDPDARCLLVVVVDAPHDPPDFAVRAFFRADATRETSLDDPTYIGSFALFSPGDHEGKGGGQLAFNLDASEALRAMVGLDTSDLPLSLVLTPIPGRTAAGQSLSVVRVELQFVSDR
ncbi:tyrosinase family protein [Nannocystis radixulma]|uniref:Tyrosinase family protein n=1 Tax=Nannocystis radixulma TaxID=2995305 RepID=A0ABT5BA12_9BACT|nr:tyrosinase family protein [Nannocystis radixulma]MDC0670349.1 tyrosinase family protein [Nannocystis radixulma]